MAKDTKKIKQQMLRRVQSSALLNKSGIWRNVGGTSGPAVPPVYSCAYLFDSTEGQVLAFPGVTGLANMVGDQAATLVVEGERVSTDYRVAGNSAFQTVDFTSGNKVIEVVLSSTVSAFTGSSGGAAVGFKVVDLNTGTLHGGLVLAVGTLDAAIVSTKANNSATSSVVYTSGPVVAGIEFNADAGTCRVVVDGAEVALAGNVFVPGTYALIVETSEADGVLASFAGEELSVTVRTSASDFTQTYSEGATDICGNPVSA